MRIHWGTVRIHGGFNWGKVGYSEGTGRIQWGYSESTVGYSEYTVRVHWGTVRIQ